MAEKSGTLSFNASLSLIFVFLFRYPHLLKRTLKKKSGSDKITKLSFRDTKYWSATLLHISCDSAVRYNRTVFLILYRLYKPHITVYINETSRSRQQCRPSIKWYLLRNKKNNNKKLRLCPICLHLKTPIQQVKNIEGRTYLVNNSTAFTLLITTEENKAIRYHRFPA